MFRAEIGRRFKGTNQGKVYCRRQGVGRPVAPFRGAIMPLDPAIRSLIAGFRRSSRWDDQLDLELLRQLWPVLAGEDLARATSLTAIYGATVVLNVPDLVWRKQLVRMKAQLLRKINEPWEKNRITEIAFTYENQ